MSTATLHAAEKSGAMLTLNPEGYFEARGLNVLVYNNAYDGNFSDSKISSVEIIQQGVRTATNGDVRMSPTPGQWDLVPKLLSRDIDPKTGSVTAHLMYPDSGFKFDLRATAAGDGVTLEVVLDQPLPEKLAGRAGLNLEFLPAAYFHHAYLADDQAGIFPLHPSGEIVRNSAVADAASSLAHRDGRPALAQRVAANAGQSSPAHSDWQLEPPAPDPEPLAVAHTLVLAPEDDARRVAIRAEDGAELRLYDGRNSATNGWFVVRTLLPAARTGSVVRWHLAAAISPEWIRPPVIGHSQLGYVPGQPKIAIIEMDRNDPKSETARLLRVEADGRFTEALAAAPKPWGPYLRYNYATFDFSSVTHPGLYLIEYGATRTRPFRIANDVYDAAWHPTLDVYLPVAMDHMSVKEAYRVWHGESHRDDALQAPVNYEHFDLYAQGPTTDTPYKPGQHIPGLNVGGWYDAGDYDIRTQTQYAVVQTLVNVWETFGLKRDETTVDETARHVEIHSPDGIPDLIEQIEHGTLQLVAQHHAVGHAICGIIEPVISEYTHLGDAASKTDNLIYNPSFKPGESDGKFSGKFDDRWAFTTHTSALNYGSAAALAAASRALRGYRDELAKDSLAIAERVWTEEHRHEPVIFEHGNTTGGNVTAEEFQAAVELLITTKDSKYAQRINELWPKLDRLFPWVAVSAVRVLPWMDADYRTRLHERTKQFLSESHHFVEGNPYGVPITPGGWAGNGFVIHFAITGYVLHKAFPDLVGRDPTYQGFNYLMGCHPASDISFVSDVGTVSKEVAYGNNRADFTFIAGGIVPGVLLLKPDFPENKEDWPFLWGENEYVVNEGPAYIFLANAVKDLTNEK